MHDLRAASRADLVHVSGWIRSAEEARLWTGTRVRYPVVVDSLEADLQFATAESWCLVQSEDVTAFGQIVPKDEDRRHLARLIVHPAQRRGGFGRALAAHLLDRARTAGAATVSLNVDAANHAARALYESLGFAAAPRPRDEPASASVYLEFAG